MKATASYLLAAVLLAGCADDYYAAALKPSAYSLEPASSTSSTALSEGAEPVSCDFSAGLSGSLKDGTYPGVELSSEEIAAVQAKLIALNFSDPADPIQVTGTADSGPTLSALSDYRRLFPDRPDQPSCYGGALYSSELKQRLMAEAPFVCNAEPSNVRIDLLVHGGRSCLIEHPEYFPAAGSDAGTLMVDRSGGPPLNCELLALFKAKGYSLAKLGNDDRRVFNLRALIERDTQGCLDQLTALGFEPSDASAVFPPNEDSGECSILYLVATSYVIDSGSSLDAVKWLLAHGADKQATCEGKPVAEHLASLASSGNMERARTAITLIAGADDVLYSAWTADDHDTPLEPFFSDIPKLRALLKRPAVHRNDKLILHSAWKAVEAVNVEALSILLPQVKDPSDEIPMLGDDDYQTLLSEAISVDFDQNPDAVIEMVNLLVAAGADPNKGEEFGALSTPPLQEIVDSLLAESRPDLFQKRLQVAELLLEAGADPNTGTVVPGHGEKRPIDDVFYHSVLGQFPEEMSGLFGLMLDNGGLPDAEMVTALQVTANEDEDLETRRRAQRIVDMLSSRGLLEPSTS